MGKHQETGLFYGLRHAAWPKRTASAGLIAGFVLVAYGFQPPVAPSAPGLGATAAKGSAEPLSLDAVASSDLAKSVSGQSILAPAVTVQADPAALVSFDRSTVQTVAKDGTHRLAFASLGLQRPAAGTLRAPLESLVPSSSFGFRINPLSGEAGEFHWGQDFAAQCGTRVYAADSGTVRAVGWHPWGGGNRVEIDHGNGLITTYNHLESIAVKQGASVEVGEVIAKVGTTGNSTGCHLHFETILNGVHTNPANWKLLATIQQDPLGDFTMHNYSPGTGTATAPAPYWAVPMTVGHVHTDDPTHYEYREHLSPTERWVPGQQSTPSVTSPAPTAPTPTAPETTSPTPSGPPSEPETSTTTNPTVIAPTDPPNEPETSTPDSTPESGSTPKSGEGESSVTPDPTDTEPTETPDATVSEPAAADPTTAPAEPAQEVPVTDVPVTTEPAVTAPVVVEPAPIVVVEPAPVVEVAQAPAPAPVVEVAQAPAPAPVLEVAQAPAPAPVVEVAQAPAPVAATPVPPAPVAVDPAPASATEPAAEVTAP
ncbi:peptidoglycan DD-metalloendopeptidase family protein [Arthrobacter sp. ISL-30]|uniref:M23 family metallopeptidase n=1 Tax=Arthrobacter sp. ISL-30 TaxID=2819109 RepID=UPI0027E18C17|nr:peptidoglycan DD-metalloendopeptidase family protein [Arthrobacter sp. ISL-30]